MKRIFVLLFAVALLAGCAADISEVKDADNVGEKVTVSGEVQGVIKIGSLSGYTVEDDTGTIGVSSESLPAEGESVRVSGTLMRDTIFGYYIKAD